MVAGPHLAWGALGAPAGHKLLNDGLLALNGAPHIITRVYSKTLATWAGSMMALVQAVVFWGSRLDRPAQRGGFQPMQSVAPYCVRIDSAGLKADAQERLPEHEQALRGRHCARPRQPLALNPVEVRETEVHLKDAALSPKSLSHTAHRMRPHIHPRLTLSSCRKLGDSHAPSHTMTRGLGTP